MTNNTYLLPVSESIHLAWSKVKGSKASIWVAILVSLVIMLALGFFDAAINTVAPRFEPVIDFIVQIIGFLLQIGLMFIGIKRAQDEPINYRMIFRGFEGPIAIRAIGVYILQGLILVIPVALILLAATFFGMRESTSMIILAVLLGIAGFIASIYLSVRMMLSMAFVLDKGINSWPAITHSFAATKENFWRIIAVIILQTLIIIVSIVPIGIGLIWTLPFAYILYGIIYKYLSLNCAQSQAPITVSTPTS